MSGLKKWMAIIMTSVTIMGNMAGQGISVMGAENEAQEVISSGNIYVTETGAKERIVRVNEDGSFVTEPIEAISSYATNAPCEHPARYLEAVGKKTDFRTVGTAGICYKERLIISNKCNKCQRISLSALQELCSSSSLQALLQTQLCQSVLRGISGRLHRRWKGDHPEGNCSCQSELLHQHIS